MTTDQRMFYRDVRPYHAPVSWADLRGPAQGSICLPHSLYWACETNTFALDDPDQLKLAYTAIVVEGTSADQERLINPDALIRVWGQLFLPDRSRQLWEDRFPQLPR